MNELRDAISKLSDISYDVSRMLAVHEERIDTLQDSSKQTWIELEKRREDIERIMTTVRTELAAERSAVEAKFDKLADALKERHDNVDKKFDDIDRVRNRVLGGFTVLNALFMIGTVIAKIYFGV